MTDYERGYAAAREDSARVADYWCEQNKWPNGAWWVASSIRALAIPDAPKTIAQPASDATDRGPAGHRPRSGWVDELSSSDGVAELVEALEKIGKMSMKAGEPSNDPKLGTAILIARAALAHHKEAKP